MTLDYYTKAAKATNNVTEINAQSLLDTTRIILRIGLELRKLLDRDSGFTRCQDASLCKNLAWGFLSTLATKQSRTDLTLQIIPKRTSIK